MLRRPPISTRTSTLFPYTTLFRSHPFAPSAARAACGLSIRGFAALRTGVSRDRPERPGWLLRPQVRVAAAANGLQPADDSHGSRRSFRSEEQQSEIQSLMRISYAVLCLKKKKKHDKYNTDDD